jgi:chemotaxis protein histidine kinase CheA
MDKLKPIRVYLSSAGALAQERQLFPQVIERLNKERAHSRGYHFEVVTGIRYDLPESERREAVLAAVRGSDIYVLTLWRTLGRREEGRELPVLEEFRVASERSRSTGRPRRLAYFRKLPPESRDFGPTKDLLSFKEEVASEDLLLREEYEVAEHWADLLFGDLANLLDEFVQSDTAADPPPTETGSDNIPPPAGDDAKPATKTSASTGASALDTSGSINLTAEPTALETTTEAPPPTEATTTEATTTEATTEATTTEEATEKTPTAEAVASGEETRPAVEHALEDQPPPEAQSDGTLPYSAHALYVIALAEQLRVRLGSPGIGRAILLTSLAQSRKESLAHAFMTRLGVQADLLARLSREHDLAEAVEIDQAAAQERATELARFGLSPAGLAASDLAKHSGVYEFSRGNVRVTAITLQVLRQAHEAARAEGARAVTAQHIFAALCLMPVPEDPGWLEQQIGTKNLDWIRATLREWAKTKQQATEEDVLLAALKAGLYAAPTAFHDGAAERDLLGFERCADALVNIILKPQTVPPLVVGIYGPWGSGKSTFMRLVRDKLVKQTTTPGRGKFRTFVATRFVWATRLLRRADAAPRPAPPPKLIPIDYDAWAYADAAKLWAGLIAHVARELDAELGWWGRFKYLCKSKSRALLGALVLGLLPVAWLVLRLLISKYSLAIGQVQLPAALSGWLNTKGLITGDYLSGVAAALGTLYTIWLQKRPVSDTVAALAAQFDSAPAAGVVHSIQDEFKTALRTKISPPAREQTDAERKAGIAQSVRKNKLKIVIFIDELDRCPLERIVDILEAIKLFLAEDIFIVLLGVDTRVASEAIRLHYKEVRNPDLPREYLEKIVQLPLRVPTAKHEELCQYLGELMQTAQPAPDDATQPQQTVAPDATTTDGARRAARPAATAPPATNVAPDTSDTNTPVVAATPTTAPPATEPVSERVSESAAAPVSELSGSSTRPGAQGAERAPDADAALVVEETAQPESARPRRETSGSPALAQLPDTQAEFDSIADLGLRFLESNPRRIKRLLNTYRYVKVLASHHTYGEPVQTSEWQKRVLAWLAFTMRWPAFMARALEEIERRGLQTDDTPNYLQLVPDDLPADVERPGEKDIKLYLPVTARQLDRLYSLAGNFLIENPLASIPPADETTPESNTAQDGSNGHRDAATPRPASKSVHELA